jgi:hypothetical protein
MDKDREIMRLRKELALLKARKEEAVAESMATKQAASSVAKATRRRRKVEVIERRRSADKQPKLNSSMSEAASTERSSQTGTDSDSRTAVIIVDEGRRWRSSVQTPTSRSSTASVDRRREPRYHSPRTSVDMARRDLCVVQVTEPQPRTRKGPKEVTKYKEVAIYNKGAPAVH